MLNLKYIPRALWASLPYQGIGVMVVDQFDVLGAWTGTSYENIGNAGGVSDGDKGDIVVAASGTIWTIDAAVLASILSRASHTGTQTAATVSDFSAAADARIAAAVINTLADVTITSPVDGQVIKRVAGVWANAADEGAAALPPVTLTSADFTSGNINLTAALHGNRTLFVDMATAWTATLNNNATGGWAAGDYVDAQAVGAVDGQVIQGTAALTTGTGASADTSAAVGRRVTAQNIGASAWRTLTSAASAGGAGAATFVAAGPTGFILPRAYNSTVVDSQGTYGAAIISDAAVARAFADTARGWRPRIGYDTASGSNAKTQYQTGAVLSCSASSGFTAELIYGIADALPAGAGGGRLFIGCDAGSNGTINGGNEPTANFEGARIGLMALSNSSQLVLGLAASSGVATTYTLNGGSGFLNSNAGVFSFRVVYQGSGPRKFTWTAQNLVSGATATGVWDGTGGQPALPDTVDLMRAGAARATVSGATSAVGLDLFGIVLGKVAA